MERIRRCARASILKALAFAAFGIGTVMMGLSFDMALALEAGAYLIALTGCVLALKGLYATRQDYRNTETWLLLGRRHDLPEHRAQGVFAGVMRDLYFTYARVAGGAAVACWLAGQSLRLIA